MFIGLLVHVACFLLVRKRVLGVITVVISLIILLWENQRFIDIRREHTYYEKVWIFQSRSISDEGIQLLNKTEDLVIFHLLGLFVVCITIFMYFYHKEGRKAPDA